MKNSITFQNLFLKKLKDFGLNPSEWSFDGISETKKLLIFKNKEDQKFQLLGIFEGDSNLAQLTGLELFSI